jgi:hypothetical protein
MKKNQMLVGQPAMGMVARSWWHPKTGSRINFGTLSGCQSYASVLQQDTIQGYYWPSHRT